MLQVLGSHRELAMFIKPFFGVTPVLIPWLSAVFRILKQKVISLLLNIDVSKIFSVENWKKAHKTQYKLTSVLGWVICRLMINDHLMFNFLIRSHTQEFSEFHLRLNIIANNNITYLEIFWTSLIYALIKANILVNERKFI